MSRSVSESLLASRYELIEPIGSGGMAEVHRAWDTLLRRHVAIKLFQPGFDPAAAQRFDNEVRTLAGLSHPGLVSVYDADTHAGTPFVVLQLVEGQTLQERISAGGPLPMEQVRQLGARLADALAHVHSHGLVHRDVKPSNILLDSEDNAYLADFGLVHLTGATRLTRTDQMVGTAAYLAPEQVLGGDVDHPADVYALGLVLLECLTAHREYPGSEVEAAIARLHRPPVVPEDLPAEVGRLLTRMTSAAPQERPTASECGQVLAGLTLPLAGVVPLAVVPATAADIPFAAAEVSTTAADVSTTAADVAEEAAEEAAPPRRRHASWKTLVASAGVLLGAMAITTAATSGEDPTSSATTTSAPPASSAQPHSPSTPQQAADTPQHAADTPQPTGGAHFVATPQAQATSGATTTPPRVTTSAAPPASAAQPVAGPGTQVTAPTTETTEQQTSIPAAPTTTETTEANPAPADPTSPPTEDGE